MSEMAVAQALYGAIGPPKLSWDEVSESSRSVFIRMAEVAIAAMELTQETRRLPDGSGGMMLNPLTGETTFHNKPQTQQVRWVGKWETLA